MSTDSADDPFFAQIQQLLSTLDEEEKECDDLELDPYNSQHIDRMRQFIINNHQIISPKDPPTNNTTDPIYKIIIKHNEYSIIDEFNGYLSSLIVNILEYAEDNKNVFHSNENNQKKRKKHEKRTSVSRYDEMLRHIPRHSHYAFNQYASLSYTDLKGISHCNNNKKSKIFRSILMKDENIEIISYLDTLIIDHFVNIESLKLIHDIIQLTKQSLINISLQFTLYHQIHQNENENADINKVRHSRNSLNINSNASFKSNVSFDNNMNNMMISCISSILKLCERMNCLESFNFNLIDFNGECYDYFTHFDSELSDLAIFKNLKSLTIHIDDKLSQTEVSSFPFYAFAASPILAFLKKLKSLTSISIIIYDENEESETDINDQQNQINIYFIKKLCEKIFEILNKSHCNLHEFYFKNIRNDCVVNGSNEFFMQILINFIKNHRDLCVINICLRDLCDDNLSDLIECIFYTDSKMKYKSCIKSLQQLSLASQTCIDSNTPSASLSNLRYHYGDASLSALLHLIYSSNTLRELSLICFYGADTIKFNALLSAINTKTVLNNIEIGQLRKDKATLYSLSKLFKQPKRRHSHNSQYKLSWNYYESIVISFGAQFGHFYHGEKLEIIEMKKFIDLILENQLLLQDNKMNLLKLITIKINKNFNLFIPNDVLCIIVDFVFGIDCLNISLLEWDLYDTTELYLLFKIIKYFTMKYDQLINTKNNQYKHNQLQWFRTFGQLHKK